MAKATLVRALFTAAFVDQYGIRHDNAQCFISTINRNEHAHFNEASDEPTSGGSCSYSVRFWHSEEAKNNGARALDYVFTSGGSQIALNDYQQLSIGDLQAACQADFLARIAEQQAPAA